MLTPSLGFGLGLRVEHYAEIFGGEPAVDWFEALTENYLVPGGKPLHNLMRSRNFSPPMRAIGLFRCSPTWRCGNGR